VVDWLMKELIGWIAAFVLDALTGLVHVLESTAFYTPDVTRLPQAQAIWSQNAAVVNTCYVLAIVAAGVLAMTHETIQVRYSVKDLAPRLIFGAIAGNSSLAWCSMIFDTANSLTQALTAQPVAGPGALEAIRAQVRAAIDNQAAAALSVFVAVLIVALVWMLMFSWIVRFGVLLILTVTAPAALACHCLPQLDSVARMWWRTLFGALGTQVLQAVTLHTGIRVFLDPATNLPAQLGMGAGSVLDLGVLVALLWTCIKIPSLMRRYVLRGGSPSGIGSYLVRVVLVQQVGRGVLPRGSAPAARAAAPAASTAASMAVPGTARRGRRSRPTSTRPTGSCGGSHSGSWRSSRSPGRSSTAPGGRSGPPCPRWCCWPPGRRCSPWSPWSPSAAATGAAWTPGWPRRSRCAGRPAGRSPAGPPILPPRPARPWCGPPPRRRFPRRCGCPPTRSPRPGCFGCPAAPPRWSPPAP
jgi:hypothetical protein